MIRCVYLHELLPSLLETAGVTSPASLDGASFLPAMLGSGVPNGREELYCVFDRHFTVANQRMVRTRTHQFTFNAHDIGELYDLVQDPYQLVNRDGDRAYAPVRRDLMARMGHYMRALDDPLQGWFTRMSTVY